MADIAATDITATLLLRKRIEGRSYFHWSLAFGNSTLTYPAGGIPITLALVGMPNIIEDLIIYDNGLSVYQWSYDRVNKKLTAMQAPVQTHTHNLLVKGGQASSTTNDIAIYGSLDTLGKEQASDATMVGSASATKGGVVSTTLAAAGLTQISTVAIAAQVLKCEVVGW